MILDRIKACLQTENKILFSSFYLFSDLQVNSNLTTKKALSEQNIQKH